MDDLKSRRILKVLNIVVLFLAAVVAVYALIEHTKAKVIVEWSTASELGTTGFNLYRSETRDGNYERVNSGLIPGSTDPLLGGKYTFDDVDVVPGKTYYYELEEVETGGKISRHGPIEVKAVAGGTSEFILAATLIAVSTLGLLALRAPRNERINEG